VEYADESKERNSASLHQNGLVEYDYDNSDYRMANRRFFTEMTAMVTTVISSVVGLIMHIADRPKPPRKVAK